MYRYSLRTVRVAFLILNPKYLYISDIDLIVLTTISISDRVMEVYQIQDIYSIYPDKRCALYILNLMYFHYSVGRYIVL